MPRQAKIIIIVVFIFATTILTINRKNKDELLVRNMVVTTGTLTEFLTASKPPAGGFTFTFIANGEKLISSGSNYSNIRLRKAEELLGRNLPVVYEANNPENCRLLLAEDDFKTFGIKYPDSLNWLKNYFK